MTGDHAALQQEVARLREEVEAHRRREMEAIRASLAAAQAAAEHYRAEAHRNADIGRQIAADYQRQLAELRAKMEAMTQGEVHARRFGARN